MGIKYRFWGCLATFFIWFLFVSYQAMAFFLVLVDGGGGAVGWWKLGGQDWRKLEGIGNREILEIVRGYNN